MFCFHELSCMAICGTHLAYPTPYYRVHHGKNRFCCWGHGVHARDMCIFHLSLLLLVGVTILFFVYEARFLTPILSPAIPTFAAILFLYVLLTFLRTAFTDPGILPRATAAETEWTKLYLAAATPLNNATVTSESVPVPQSFNPDSYTRDVLIRDHLVRLNFCHSCGFFRPPRSSHCSTCDNCVGESF
ncbi:unnamed protein product [Dicrocoelium dendriticum]|nr:unnamed protein product [Dicrocoelium dendriticum]